MTWKQRIVGAVRSLKTPPPKPGQSLVPRLQDVSRYYPSAGLTPARLVAILREADEGSPSAMFALYEDMEEKDAHLYAVAQTRRLSLTGLPWQIVSANNTTDEKNQKLADQTADYCRRQLQRCDSFDATLQHLSLAVGRNIAISEIIWDVVDAELRPIEFIPVDFSRIVFDEFDHPRLLTSDNDREGIAPPPNKFIIHTPHSVSGHPQRGGVARVTAMIYLAKNLAIKDWMIFAEIFGMPVRVARYGPNTTAEEKKQLIHMLESLGSQAAGLFSQSVELQLLEPSRSASGAPYEGLIQFLNRELSKAWLGQTLSTDITGQSGSIAAAQVHERVRGEILADDMRKEARTIHRDILTPLVRMRFGHDAPIPQFRRITTRFDQRLTQANLLEQASNKLGLSIPKKWMHEILNIPQDQENELPAPPKAT